ncbi:MAG: hypothetical protein A2Z07_04095 [Armatimonadetes bacterium RBG_16_67_12]|nr:MAG: hypothetical protein A2Z07_04095 [Armatimonadetes bacterium RBG_16_67_12]
MPILQGTVDLDNLASTPIYVQLREMLRAQVTAGDLRPGARLPSERELARQFGISRMTARAAISQLADLGHVRRVPGKGTFVQPPKMVQGLQTLTSFTEDMRSRGKSTSARVLEQTLTPATPYVAGWLGVRPGAQVVEIRRLRLAEREPMSLEIAYLPAPRFAYLLEEDLTVQSLYEVLARHGVELGWADQTVEARLAAREESAFLRVPRRAPVLRTERTTCDVEGRPVEHVQSVYRADRYTFKVTLLRRR